MKNIVIIPILIVLVVCSSFTPVEVRDFEIRTVVIDAGHGGKDPGTSGEMSLEKDITLNIALELGSTIKKYMKDVNVIYTRTVDTYIELTDRPEIANKNGADVFISIHCNAVPANKDKIYGTETYIMGMHKSDHNFEVAKRENSVLLLEENNEVKYEGFNPTKPESYILFSMYQNANLENSLLLADMVEEQFKSRVGRNSRGVRQAGFWVLYRTSMPAILVETGYLTNKKEEKYLNDPLGQTYIASGIFRALRDYKEHIESMN